MVERGLYLTYLSTEDICNLARPSAAVQSLRPECFRDVVVVYNLAALLVDAEQVYGFAKLLALKHHTLHDLRETI